MPDCIFCQDILKIKKFPMYAHWESLYQTGLVAGGGSPFHFIKHLCINP